MATSSRCPSCSARAGLLALAATVALAGCGKKVVEPALVPVRGLVRLDGQPLSGASVTFLPGSGPVAYATTDADGRFDLVTGAKPGAVPGTHRVTVLKVDTAGLEQLPPDYLSDDRLKWLSPRRYSSPKTTDLKADVVAGGPEIALDLVTPPPPPATASNKKKAP